VRFQKLMWCNMIRSTKSKKVSTLYYSIDIDINLSLFSLLYNVFFRAYIILITISYTFFWREHSFFFF
jgi:hypothetical protein